MAAFLYTLREFVLCCRLQHLRQILSKRLTFLLLRIDVATPLITHHGAASNGRPHAQEQDAVAGDAQQCHIRRSGTTKPPGRSSTIRVSLRKKIIHLVSFLHSVYQRKRGFGATS
ncbi:hypothetical protein ACONUD_09230 [Microbulbifer harenosus]|uniref:Secreted protein n=1 Tax=Microbulbifer harenosus TaxID=2576840 RepID=A0ABY2UGV8_9GAMM|nr:hypothetical protein [Microbulbifer harenosus]TLM76997.1 hypothetical protein FDY93_11590 [Microbulbifer harenosus]